MKYHADSDTSADEPDLTWESSYAEPGRADRNIAIRNRPDLIPAEERKSIVSNRVMDIDPHSNTSVRLESGLEGGLLALLKAEPGCVAVRTQYKVQIMVEGVWHDYWFDFCADFENGCRILYSVRNEENSAEVEDIVELFRNQELSNHAHYALVVTEEAISKPAIYRAEQIVEARRRNNEANNSLVLRALMKAGGCERVAKVLMSIPEVTFSSGWDAIWALIDRGLIIHHHRSPETTKLERHSWIRATGLSS